jgi:hypothetical protein
MIPQGSPSCYDSAMRNLVVLFILSHARTKNVCEITYKETA